MVSMINNNMMENIYFEDFQVRHSEVDMYNILKLKSIFDYLQEAAANHAKILGVGMDDMANHKLAWVLSRIHLKLDHQVSVGTKLRLKTYPSGREKLFFRREFELMDSNNELVVAGSSYWLVIDTERLRPVRESYIDTAALENLHLPKLLDYQNEPAPFVETSSCYIYKNEFVVNYSAIDINKHLNNANYAMLIQDVIYDELQTQFFFKNLQITFNIAQKLDEKISVISKVCGNLFQVIGKTKDDKIIFTANGKIELPLNSVKW